jgi:hypothetical protein
MIEITPLEDLGKAEHGWLSARFHFSFAEYQNPDRVNFGPLRVWNDDTIQPGTGFPMHGHEDMEIITYVRQGAISHEDNRGNKGVTVAGDVQVMSAGTGIVHSEYNLTEGITQIFQIWIHTDKKGHEPHWDAATFPKAVTGAETGAERDVRLVALASGRDGMEGTLMIHQDATLFAATLNAGQSVRHVIEPGRRVYLVPPRGRIEVNGHEVPERAGVAIEDEAEVAITALDDAEVVLVDLP